MTDMIDLDAALGPPFRRGASVSIAPVLAVSAFALTSLTSAALMFAVEPLVAKAMLPLLGGTPAVWVTCMAFFQAALLVGYLYVHLVTRWLGVRRQSLVHLVLLAMSFVALPLVLPVGWNPPEESNAVLWITGALVVIVGAPFVLLSATAPMLQTWFSRTGHTQAADPYFLYVPSNVGSLLALGSYPFLIEPNIGLAAQASIWSSGYVLFAALVTICSLVLWQAYTPYPSAGYAPVRRSDSNPADALPAASGALRLRWLALSFAPSSLLLGVTTYLTTDVAAVPLLWVVPLALYLLTFILVFARRQLLPHNAMVSALPFLLLPLVLVMLWGEVGSAWLTIALHLATFFVGAMVCHGELVRLRPRASDLTEFYLWMSVGGLAGGLFNAIVAPLVFPLVLEYPIALVLVALLRPGVDHGRGLHERVLDVILPVAAGAGAIWAIVPESYGEDDVGRVALTVVAALAGLAWSARPIRFGVWVAALLVAAPLYGQRDGNTVFRDRSFFGVSRVVEYTSGWRDYFHGTTLHGTQDGDWLDPTSYYTESGPFGDVAEAYLGDDRRHEVAAMGLGVGTINCYGAPGDTWHFLEIDPVVVDVADRYFTYLSECPADAEIHLGDARLTIATMSDGAFDLIVADAFSSDAIPVHLVTREAVETYLRKLKEGGAIAFNISNRYVNLEPVLADLADELGVVAAVRRDGEVSEEESELHDKAASTWLVLAYPSDNLSGLLEEPGWQVAETDSNVRYWTDDFSNIVSVLN